MSHPLSKDDILFRQRILSCSGVYHRGLDGDWGKFTDEADRDFFAGCDEIAKDTHRFDERTERNIRSMRLDAQRLCRISLAAIRGSGLDARVISGTRTYPEQT